MEKDQIGTRMKLFYENRGKAYLTRRTPVICRIDGKGFSGFCKRFEKPFDPLLHQTFNETVKHLCREVSGVIFAEHHSDEISLLLCDYQSLQTEAYFDYEVQKMVSVIAGLTTAEFCRLLCRVDELGTPENHLEHWPSFDCRCFNIPKEEVENYMWWRINDSVRGSINMLAQSKFSHKELQNKSCSQMQEMLFQTHGINWNDLPQVQKSGYCFVKTQTPLPITEGLKIGEIVMRNVWSAIPSPATRTELTKLFQTIDIDKQSVL
jgi:tRNA(His) 5'-end guanylyltransferase